jgi:hypothetical protein
MDFRNCKEWSTSSLVYSGARSTNRIDDLASSNSGPLPADKQRIACLLLASRWVPMLALAGCVKHREYVV